MPPPFDYHWLITPHITLRHYAAILGHWQPLAIDITPLAIEFRYIRHITPAAMRYDIAISYADYWYQILLILIEATILILFADYYCWLLDADTPTLHFRRHWLLLLFIRYSPLTRRHAIVFDCWYASICPIPLLLPLRFRFIASSIVGWPPHFLASLSHY
jgi:hypothetical protein